MADRQARAAAMVTDFVCTFLANTWSMKADKDGLFDSYRNPPCPECGTNGADPNDYGDWKCPDCNHEWRKYGNGGLVLGMWPNCPKSATTPEQA
ncbi:hypothetical protein [Nocardioides sp. NPDC006303]|uniref:hypothetical protein n=1 Tax=Nocardioides sp. NPDC006303 TaxID=3156747 RepID=UPI0033AAED0B